VECQFSVQKGQSSRSPDVKKTQKLPHLLCTCLLTAGGSRAGGLGTDCKLDLTIARPNLLSRGVYPPNANDAISLPLLFPPPSPFPLSPLLFPSLPLSLPQYPFSRFPPPSFPSFPFPLPRSGQRPLKSARGLRSLAGSGVEARSPGR